MTMGNSVMKERPPVGLFSLKWLGRIFISNGTLVFLYIKKACVYCEYLFFVTARSNVYVVNIRVDRPISATSN